jgi:hypothetical protein
VKNKKNSVDKLQEEEGSKDRADDNQSSGSTGAAKIFGGATSSKYAWREEPPFRTRSCSSAQPSNDVRLDGGQSSWERLNVVVEGKIEGVFGRFEQSADAVFPSSNRFTSTEDDDESLNEKEMLLQGGGKSSQEERMNTSCPSLSTVLARTIQGDN